MVKKVAPSTIGFQICVYQQGLVEKKNKNIKSDDRMPHLLVFMCDSAAGRKVTKRMRVVPSIDSQR